MGNFIERLVHRVLAVRSIGGVDPTALVHRKLDVVDWGVPVSVFFHIAHRFDRSVGPFSV